MSLRLAVVLGLVVLAGQVTRSRQPLANLDGFLLEVRARLQTDAQRQYGYMYIETRRRTTLDADGRATGGSVTVIESHPGFPGEPRWNRVIVRDGERLSEADLRRQDEARQRETRAYARQVGRQTDVDREKQEREWARQRRELSDTLDDVFRVYDIVMLGRERIDEHDTIVFSLTPRPDTTPVSEDGQWFRHFSGRAWISESEYELVRLDVEAIDDVGIGMGLLARVHEGTVASFERRKMDGNVWLPTRTTYTLSARVLVVKQIRETVTSEFTNYRKATDTVSMPANPTS